MVSRSPPACLKPYTLLGRLDRCGFRTIPTTLAQSATVKPRSHDQITHRFRPRFALFPVVGTGRFDAVRGFLSASVVSRDLAVNSSDIKGPDGDNSSANYSAVAKFRVVRTARMFEFHRPQSTNANLEVWTSHTSLEQGFRGDCTYVSVRRLSSFDVRAFTDISPERSSHPQTLEQQ
ncbi:hypothetical protein AVEN_106594-1 [Araneus ventricosus]|uniref:Uncharacterized protein n=1 Tax=Araneus ventricosus TaxID=182803 RepID=A0A4Y2IX12_ARAVE|nr:hypothetical protein AVEN_106594-1 [Araneus ventricosus]